MVKFGGGNIRVCGAISARGIGMLETITGTLSHHLGYCLIPTAYLQGYGERFYLQDDGAPNHRSNMLTNWKSELPFSNPHGTHI